MTKLEIAQEIYARYKRHNDGFIPRGACIHIAYEVFKATGASVAAGYLTSATGWRMSHWWNETETEILDPMGDEYKSEPGFQRERIHGDFNDFMILWGKRKNLYCDMHIGEIE